MGRKIKKGRGQMKLLKVAGGVVAIGVLAICFLSLLSDRQDGNVAKVANQNMKKDSFFADKNVNTETFIGNHFQVKNGFHVYEDDFVRFYVDNPLLQGKNAESFFVNFDVKSKKACTDTIQSFNFHDNIDFKKNREMKSVTLDGESIRSSLKTRRTISYFYCDEKPAGETYHIRYEFYFD